MSLQLMGTLLGLMVGAGLFSAGVVELRASMRASLGHGSSGSFTAVVWNCARWCHWQGDWSSDDGRTVRRNVEGIGFSKDDLTVGVPVRAIDSGSLTKDVYKPGTSRWSVPLTLLFFGLVLLALCVTALWVGLRERRRLRKSQHDSRRLEVSVPSAKPDDLAAQLERDFHPARRRSRGLLVAASVLGGLWMGRRLFRSLRTPRR